LKIIKNEQKIQVERKLNMGTQEKKSITILLNSNEKRSFKESIQSRFKSLIKLETIRILSDLNNYQKSHVCQICNQKIKDLKVMNYFQMYKEDGEQYITLHFICAFKPGTTDAFHEIAGNVDYTFYIGNE